MAQEIGSTLETIGWLVSRAAAPDTEPAEQQRVFGQIVARFQDMAFGCAYALLGDMTRAEDAAQDAFVLAWQRLPQLRDPDAFPGWLKRIVISQCRRQTRRAFVPTVPLESDLPLAGGPEPQVVVEAAERARRVRTAIGRLPEAERLVVALFYVNEHTRDEIAGFLGVSPVVVKKRLARARGRLKEGLLDMVQDDLQESRPSNDEAFAERVLSFTQQFSQLIDAGESLVRSLLRLAERQDDAAFRAALTQVREQIEQGDTLSGAMSRHPQFFGKEYLRIVREGEVNGTLKVALQRLAAGEHRA